MEVNIDRAVFPMILHNQTFCKMLIMLIRVCIKAKSGRALDKTGLRPIILSSTISITAIKSLKLISSRQLRKLTLLANEFGNGLMKKFNMMKFQLHKKR